MSTSAGRDDQPSGREPTEARSALTLRLVLAVVGLVVALVGAAAAWWLVDPRLAALALALLALAVVAAVNVAVVAVRITQRSGRRTPRSSAAGRSIAGK